VRASVFAVALVGVVVVAVASVAAAAAADVVVVVAVVAVVKFKSGALNIRRISSPVVVAAAVGCAMRAINSTHEKSCAQRREENQTSSSSEAPSRATRSQASAVSINQIAH
jgi:hypothetical protein